MKRTAKRVETLAKDNQLGKATRHLLQNADQAEWANRMNNSDSLAIHEQKVENLSSKLMKMEEENKLEPMTHHVTPINKKTVYETIKKMARGTASSLDGWSRGILMSAVSVDPSISEDLGIILAMIASTTQANATPPPQQQQQQQQQDSANQQTRKQQQQQQKTREEAQQNNTNSPQNWCRYFDQQTMDLIRSARLVGIPKEDQKSWRPIVISSFFGKLTGACLLRRAEVNNLFKYQYAISRPNGAKIIGHVARVAFDKGKAIIRLDLKNAYGLTLRKKVLELMKKNNVNADLMAYFHTMYSMPGKLVIYGPRGIADILEMEDGIRQGDSPSTVAFCIVMEEVCRLIKEEYPDDNVLVFSYADDCSIIVDDPAIARKVAECAVRCARKCGFTVNVDKSSVTCKNGIPEDEDAAVASSNEVIPISNPNAEFKMLGVNITNEFTTFNNGIVKRIDAFFDSIDAINIHPELKHLILNFCGRPRLLYYCETTPPRHGMQVVAHFQDRMKRSFAKLINISDIDSIRDSMLYNSNGGNLPNYRQHYEEIYNKTVMMIQSGNLRAAMVELISTSRAEFTSPECAHDRLWTHYTAATTVQQLSVQHYKTALAIRCKLIPDDIRGEDRLIRCDCTALVTTKNLSAQEERDLKEAGIQVPLLEHIIKCPRLHDMHYVERHDYVKNAIRTVANRYGIRAHVEPKYYHYSSGQHNRPDLTFCVQNRAYITTDITIVQPVDSTDEAAIGLAASRASLEKIAKHSAAVSQLGHRFVPFALETTGHMDVGCFALIQQLKSSVPFASRLAFVRDMRGAVSTAMAQYRAEVLRNTLTRVRANLT